MGSRLKLLTNLEDIKQLSSDYSLSYTERALESAHPNAQLRYIKLFYVYKALTQRRRG